MVVCLFFLLSLKIMSEIEQIENKATDLENLSKEELVERVKRLEIHVNQLKNVIAKSGKNNNAKNMSMNQRPFDFKKYCTRHVALKLLYLGWNYDGLAVQEDTDRTIEAVLFDALLKTRLIQSRETSNYHRCGRTDKGVSAFSQVISIDLRSNLFEGKGIKVSDDALSMNRQGDRESEIRYIYILNKVLPPEIRVLAWSPVEPDFSARFNCRSRTYKYYFPSADLDVNRMKDAASRLVGEKDFRNLCKMDVGNGVINYIRRIVSADIKLCPFSSGISRNSYVISNKESLVEENSEEAMEASEGTPAPSLDGLDWEDRGYQMYELTIVGLAFLWHQIRCIVAVLMLVGEGKEEPSIVDELLDVNKHPKKPQYTMASEIPLVLFNCEYDDIKWQFDDDSQDEATRHLQNMWTLHSIKTSMLRDMLKDMNRESKEPRYQLNCLTPGNKPRTYKPLLDRQKCESLEDRIEFHSKKRKWKEDKFLNKEMKTEKK